MKQIIFVIGSLSALALATPGQAQETVNGGMVVLGPLRSSGPVAIVDFTTAGTTAPVKSGTLAARPGTCAVGQMYFATDAAAGQNLAYCTSSGTWTAVAGGGGSSTGGGVNIQSGTSYTMQDTDGGRLVSFSNGSAVAVTLPRAGASSLFAAGWVVDAQNRGAGSVTITPVTSTIDGASSLVLAQNQGVRIESDGTSYFTQRGIGGGASTNGALGQALTSNGAGGFGTPVTLAPVAATGSASDLAAGTLAAARLPFPGASSLGGVQSKDCTSVGMVQRINTDGTVTCAAAGGVASPYTSLRAGFTAYSNPEPCVGGTLSYTDIQAAANTNAIPIANVSEPFSARTMYSFESTRFASGSITSLTMSLGPAGTPAYYLPAFPLMQTTPATHDGGSVPAAGNTGATAITATFTSDGVHNLSALTAGAVQIKICGVVLQ